MPLKPKNNQIKFLNFTTQWIVYLPLQLLLPAVCGTYSNVVTAKEDFMGEFDNFNS